MRIRLLFFGQVKDILGKQEDTREIVPGTTLSDLLADYAQNFPGFKLLTGVIACSINQEYAAASTVLHDGDEVGFLPPVSGGAGPMFQSPHCVLVREPIASSDITNSMKQPEDGAVIAFEGVVRNNTRSRRTLYLDYQSYSAMAINQMEQLCKEALLIFSIRDVRLVHRLGRLEIGETSVLVAVASGHRAAAFEACRWLIDTLKKTVPIWKKEYFEDGAIWADGEPFPEEIREPK
jgi:MoaE-MoaD fusion protein